MTFITLDYLDLALAATLVLVNAALSMWLQLGLGRRFLIAAVRMAVQLTLVGVVLKVLFAVSSPFWTGPTPEGVPDKMTSPGAKSK